ncbi:MAG: hypothetical protein O2904_00330 [bacterium]|nr:hypothetical protein [bacterium]
MDEQDELAPDLETREDRYANLLSSSLDNADTLAASGEIVKGYTLEGDLKELNMNYPTGFEEKEADQVFVKKIAPDGLPGRHITITRWQIPNIDFKHSSYQDRFFTRVLIDIRSELGHRDSSKGVMVMTFPPKASKDEPTIEMKHFHDGEAPSMDISRLDPKNDLTFNALFDAARHLNVDMQRGVVDHSQLKEEQRASAMKRMRTRTQALFKRPSTRKLEEGGKAINDDSSTAA